jgi:hypothetical protein
MASIHVAQDSSHDGGRVPNSKRGLVQINSTFQKKKKNQVTDQREVIQNIMVIVSPCIAIGECNASLSKRMTFDIIASHSKPHPRGTVSTGKYYRIEMN